MKNALKIGEELLMILGAIPGHLLQVIVALVAAIGNDRTAACLFLGTVILALCFGWAAVGGVLILYGVLLFAHAVVQAFLQR